MTQGSIQGRDAFLDQIASKLGRPASQKVEKPDWHYKPQWEVYRNYTSEDLLAVFLKACEKQGTEVCMTSSSDLTEGLSAMMAAFGGGPVIASRDNRFGEYGIESFLRGKETYFWDVGKSEVNIEQAKQANIGISFADQALAESGTTVFYHNRENARSISMLPKTSIVIFSKNSIVPRLTQAAKTVADRVKNGEQIEGYINMVSGPSNSADIEMNMVVGVHGPIKVGYIILEDK